MNSKNATKLAFGTSEIPLFLRSITQFLEKLESWLERLNMPLLYGSIQQITDCNSIEPGQESGHLA
mgnify:FL=1